MKTLLLTVTLMTLFTSCGGLNEMCGSDLRMGCNTVFGKLPKDYDDRLDTIEDRLDDVEADLGQLFARDTFLETKIDNSVTAIEGDLADTNDAVATNRSAIEDNQILIDVIELVIEDLEDELDAHNFRLAGLEANRKVKAIIKPCPTAKEVLLKFDNGILLAYFENGGNRYLSELSNGSYITSDGTGCNFTVTGSGTVNLAVTQN